MIKITECDDQHLIDRNEKKHTQQSTQKVLTFFIKYLYIICI